MQRFMEAFDLRKKVAALFVVLTATCAIAMGMSSVAYAATTPDYTLSTYSTGEYDQHVVVTLDYGEEVILADNANVQTVDDNVAITIAGRDITSSDYNRPVTVSIDGTKLVFDIGNCVDANGAATFTAQYSGVITLTGTPQNITIDGDDPDALNITTLSPTGVALTQTSSGNTGSVTYNVSHTANVRGMVHVGIYKEDANGKLIPINPTAGTINCYTYTTHAHAFTTLTAANYATSIAGFSLPTGYSITASGDSFTLTGPSTEKLHVYIFDSVSLKTLNTDYTSVVNTGTGELNPDGSEK